jgi:AAA+ ATPase superfamily predicted ATPase
MIQSGNLAVLRTEFDRIKNGHARALRLTASRAVLLSSVIRVFRRGTKSALHTVLESIAVDELPNLASKEEFRNWFEQEWVRWRK